MSGTGWILWVRWTRDASLLCTYTLSCLMPRYGIGLGRLGLEELDYGVGICRRWVCKMSYTWPGRRSFTTSNLDMLPTQTCQTTPAVHGPKIISRKLPSSNEVLIWRRFPISLSFWASTISENSLILVLQSGWAELNQGYAASTMEAWDGAWDVIEAR